MSMELCKYFQDQKVPSSLPLLGCTLARQSSVLVKFALNYFTVVLPLCKILRDVSFQCDNFARNAFIQSCGILTLPESQVS